MQGCFSADPYLFSALFDLLDLVFPGIRRGAEGIRTLGVSWESASTPFVRWADGRIVSHVGVIPLPLMVMGRRVTTATLHAVATHPDYRRRGYFRQAMEEALAYCAGRYETVLLTTEHPEYYTSFGFRHVQECRFVARISAAGGPGARLLELSRPADLALLHRLLAERETASNMVGVTGDKTVFMFNESGQPLYYVEALDAALCLEREGERLRLYDVVAPRMPPLDALAARLPWPIAEVEIYFSPDRLAVEAEATPYLLDHDGPSYLMVRGPFAAEGQPFTLPRSART